MLGDVRALVEKHLTAEYARNSPGGSLPGCCGARQRKEDAAELSTAPQIVLESRVSSTVHVE